MTTRPKNNACRHGRIACCGGPLTGKGLVRPITGRVHLCDGDLDVGSPPGGGAHRGKCGRGEERHPTRRGVTDAGSKSRHVFSVC